MPRGSDILQNLQNLFFKYPKIDYQGFAFSCRHYAAENPTTCDIQIVDLFGLSKFKEGQCPPGPPWKEFPCYNL